MTHDDCDSDLWIESEGSLSIESQQFGPWIKVAPFVPTQRNMIKVPGFFASKKSGAWMTNSKSAKKPLVVVVRIGKPSPEIIRLGKESFEVSHSENMIPNFQEDNPLNFRPLTNEGIIRDLNSN